MSLPPPTYGIVWLVRLRWLAVVGVAFAILIAWLLFPGALPFGLLMFVAAGVAAYNLVTYLALRSADLAARPRTLTLSTYVPILLDLMALATLLHLSGGAENPAALFFVLHVAIAGILLGRNSSYVVAGIASLLFVAVVSLEFSGLVPHTHLPLLVVELRGEGRYLALVSGSLTVTLLLVAYLTTSIAARLRQRERALQIAIEETEAANEQLRQVDAERTRFLMLITHELRSPLSIIYSGLDLVLEGYASEDQAREVLGRAQSRASELLELIDDLLDLTRARESRHSTDGTPAIHPGGPLRDAVDLLRFEAERKGVNLATDVAADLGLARAASDEMKLVWSNLLSNAIKYTPAGGEIRASLSQTPDVIVGSVRDTGIGVAPDELPRIFDEFYRAQNAREVSPHGTGIGLAIVRRILNSRGGTIDVESQPGHGTTFTFTLPRADVKHDT